MQIDLTGTRVLVTGASRGIGRALARHLAHAGATVAAHYHQAAGAAQELVEEMGDGGSCTLGADLSTPDGAGSLVGRAREALGGLEVLICNAGVALEAPLSSPLEQWISAWDRTQAVNLRATAILCRDALAHFQTQGVGRIITIASRAAFRGDVPDYLAYAASKGGIVSLTRSIARAFGRSGITAFVVAPGYVRTDMAQAFIEKYGEAIARESLALDRVTEPDDLAPVVTLLASGLADHATGCTIDINAGSYVH